LEDMQLKHEVEMLSLKGDKQTLENLNQALYRTLEEKIKENEQLKKEVEELSSPGNVVGAMMESIDGKPRRGRKPKEVTN
ncbi:MAG: hypothetical protein ACRCZH_06805, partial [Cetobacterium sp.]